MRLRTWLRQALTAPSTILPSGKKRSVRRTAPTFRLRAAMVSPLSPISSSVEPPPMSTSSRRRSKTGTAWSTPRWISRASSTPEITSTWTPASWRARSRNSLEFVASRTALVRDGAHRSVVAIGESLHPLEARQPSTQGIGRQQLHVAAPRTEPDDLALAGQRLETVPTDGSGDDQVDAVRSDVDRRQCRGGLLAGHGTDSATLRGSCGKAISWRRSRRDTTADR